MCEASGRAACEHTGSSKQTSSRLGLFAPAIDEQFLFTLFRFLSLFHWLISNLSLTSISSPSHVYLLDTIY